MGIIGCDLHARQQTVAMLETTMGEAVNVTLLHEGNKVFFGDAGSHAVRRDPDLQRFYCRKLVQKDLGKSSVAVFCRRVQKRQKSSGACTGMQETPYGAKSHRPCD